MDIEEIWQSALGELEVTLSKANFNTWFGNAFPLDFKKGYFTIGVPNFFFSDYLQKHYLKDITKAIQAQVEERISGIKFKVAVMPAGRQTIPLSTKVIHNPVDNSPSPKAVKPTAGGQLLSNNITLNDNYKFTDFIVGPNNQLAHAAALAVAGKPGQLYNPVYIYGDSGLGKTHLMQAIGHASLENSPNKNVLYVSTETFINDFISAIESGHGRTKDFKGRYRNVDLLLIDDIQFLSNKEQTQDEFFHTFNHLYQNKKQVVLTSDRPPKDIKGLETRLKTRFEGGMVCDITPPDLETREAILRSKAKKQNLNIHEEGEVDLFNQTVRFIAENIQSSIRELEGALTKVIMSSSVSKKPISPQLATEVLQGMVQEKRNIITSELIIKEVHRYFRIPIEDLLGKKRNKEIVLPRQITMYLLRHETGVSYPEIGKTMGGRDHSTIIHGCEKIEADISSDKRLKDDISYIKEKIYSLVK